MVYSFCRTRDSSWFGLSFQVWWWVRGKSEDLMWYFHLCYSTRKVACPDTNRDPYLSRHIWRRHKSPSGVRVLTGDHPHFWLRWVLGHHLVNQRRKSKSKTDLTVSYLVEPRLRTTVLSIFNLPCCEAPKVTETVIVFVDSLVCFPSPSPFAFS